MVTRLAVLAALAALAVLPPAAGAAVQAHLDRNPVSENEAFRLTFELDDKPANSPDFSALRQHFEILGTNERSNISILNGDLERSTTIILNLMPKAAGTYRIPAIDFGNARSEPLEVRVLEAPDDKVVEQDLLLEAEIDDPDPLVQAQVLLTVRLLRTVEINNATLSDPELSGSAVVEKLGKDRNYHTTRDGRRFAVIERRFALYPQESGELTIAPFRFEGQVIAGERSFFDPFGQSITTRRLETEPIELQVRPAPPAFTGDTWLPAASLELKQVWSDNGAGQWRVGTPVTRTVAVIAKGLTSGQLPELRQNLPGDVKVYPEQPVLNDQTSSDGITGVRQEKLAIIPSRPGPLELPPITLRWWSTVTGEQRTARLPGRSVQVLAAAGGAGPPAAGADRPAEEPPAPAADPAPPASLLEPWKLAAAVLAVGWLVTLWAWLRGRRGPGGDHARPDAPQTYSNVKIRELCRLIETGEPSEIKRALLQWAHAIWPDSPPASLAELALRAGEPLATELRSLSASLYGAGGRRFDRQALAVALERWHQHRDPTRTLAGGQSALEPLFRHDGGGNY